jgi:hypothetical protein
MVLLAFPGEEGGHDGDQALVLPPVCRSHQIYELRSPMNEKSTVLLVMILWECHAMPRRI